MALPLAALTLAAVGVFLFYFITHRLHSSEPVSASPHVVAKTPLTPQLVTQERLSAAKQDSDNWLTHGRTYDEQRFSPLKQIDRNTIGRLKLHWIVDLPEDERGQESTPLVIDGVLYLTTSWSRVWAFDAASGRELWRHDPKVPGAWGPNTCCDVVNRGLAAWRDQVYVGTLDGRLVSLDAKTGTKTWESLVIDRAERASITGAPRIIKGRVFIGSSGGEFAVRGRHTAVNADTGAVLWRFFTVPGNPAVPPENLHLRPAARTWTGEWWKHGGGGTVWDAMAYDATPDILYVGTGNGAPWPQSIRSPTGGDNLYVSSILAMRGETGELLWHYQTTPGDEWGYDAASQLVLADLLIDGRPRQVLMQASANGFFYVLDRTNGQLISATPFVPTTWARSVDPASGRPVEDPLARYSRTGRPFLARPGPRGAHSWQPMTFSPATGLMYIPGQFNSAQLSVSKEPLDSRYRTATGVTITRPGDAEPDSSALIAWDPLAQRAHWVIERDSPVASGLLSTAGDLVFQGTSNGTLEAFDAEVGKRLWQTTVGAPLLAAPISYAVNGTQYIAAVAGGGGATMLEGGERMAASVSPRTHARVLVFSLQGKASLPTVVPTPSPAKLAGDFATDTRLVSKGESLYAANCARCHGLNTINAGPLKSLTASDSLGEPRQWNLIAYAGLLSAKGMPGFMGDLNPDEVEAIRAFVVQRAKPPSGDPPSLTEPLLKAAPPTPKN